MIELQKLKAIPGLKLPGFSQIGIAVRDIDQAMVRFSACYDIRTWYRRRFDGADYDTSYRGKKISMDLDVAFFYSGKIPIALLQASHDEENTFTEHLNKYGEGFHHFTHLVKDIDRYLQAASDAGIDVIQTGIVKDGPAVTRFEVLDTAELCGYLIEIQEVTFLGIHLGMSQTMTRLGCLTGAVSRVTLPR